MVTNNSLKPTTGVGLLTSNRSRPAVASFKRCTTTPRGTSSHRKQYQEANMPYFQGKQNEIHELAR